VNVRVKNPVHFHPHIELKTLSPDAILTLMSGKFRYDYILIYSMIKTLFYFLLLLSFSSCSILKPSIMLKTKRNYPYAQAPSTPQYEYKIAPNDVISFRISSNDGFKLIDLTSLNEGMFRNAQNTIEYLVEHDGLVKLPIIGRISLQGLTIRQAEQMLEEKYSTYYNKPFLMLKVLNRRVIVFPGTGGKAKVINLENNNTTLLEALALSGGIANTGKAKRIKLIRGNLKDPEVYLIDLSTIEGMKQADMVLQANDIIYVEPVLKISQTLLVEMSPFIGILTNILIVIALFK